MIDERLPLILGSASPRRREILSNLGIAHVVRAGAADETVGAGESPQAYLERVALLKLDAVRGASRDVHGAGILVADTSVVAPDGSILGKPADEAEAMAMLLRLAGATHEVHTRFVIGTQAEGGPLHAETCVTRVTFRPLRAGEAESYAKSREGFDKAGGYAVQGRAAGFASRIDGSYSNVVGLPACEVAVALARLGWIA